jgi:hypothetical protein
MQQDEFDLAMPTTYIVAQLSGASKMANSPSIPAMRRAIASRKGEPDRSNQGHPHERSLTLSRGER